MTPQRSSERPGFGDSEPEDKIPKPTDEDFDSILAGAAVWRSSEVKPVQEIIHPEGVGYGSILVHSDGRRFIVQDIVAHPGARGGQFFKTESERGTGGEGEDGSNFKTLDAVDLQRMIETGEVSVEKKEN